MRTEFEKDDKPPREVKQKFADEMGVQYNTVKSKHSFKKLNPCSRLIIGIPIREPDVQTRNKVKVVKITKLNGN